MTVLEPVPEMTPVMVVLPAPVTVRVWAKRSMFPDRIRAVPLSAPTVASPPRLRVMGPAKELVPLTFSTAPLPAEPEPMMLTACGVE